MMVKKKKAQTTIEILIIFGVLILGVILFGLFYFTNLHTKIDTSSTVQGTYSDIEKNLQGGDPIAIQAYCGDGICNSNENCSNCSSDCGTCDTDSDCPSTAPILQITRTPVTGVPAGAPEHNTFNLQIAVIRQSEFSGKTIKIKKVIFNESQTDVFYQGQIQIPTTGLVINQDMVENTSGNFLYNITNLSSTKSGYNVIKVFAEVSGCDLNSEAKTMITIKGLSANLSLSPDGTSNRDEPFGVDINVNNYNSDSNVSITKIYVADTNNTLLDNVCSYNGNLISSSGQVVNILMNKTYNDYNYSFKDTFSCKYSGQYKLMFTLHDNDENTDYDYNATIEKSIKDRCLYLGNKGDGTESKPYVISNPEDLDCIRYNLSKHFILGDNIDLNHALMSSNSEYYWYDDTKGWNPIGTMDSPFTGSFNGADYEIQNLYSRRNDSSFRFALFRNVDNSSFSNLNLTGVDINGHSSSGSLVFSASNSTFDNINVEGSIGTNGVGGIVGSSANNYFNNCSFTGEIRGVINVGGIVGESFYANETGPNANSFNDCTVDINISGPTYTGDGYFTDSAYIAVGGIIGAVHSYGTTISDCNVTGNIKSQGFTGGLVGEGGGIEINNSSFIGNINSHVNVGGLIGYGSADVIKSHAEVNITNAAFQPAIGNASIPGLWGGIGGHIGGSIVNSSAIVNMQPISISESNQYVGYMGGLIGWSEAVVIQNSYSEGDIIIADNKIYEGRYIGGLAGHLQNIWPDYEYGIKDNYSKVNISTDMAGYRIGGLFGSASSNYDINNSYSIGNINVSGTKTNVGGLIGIKSSTVAISNSYWNTETSGQTTSAGGSPRTTDQMTYPDYPSTYTDWDFSSVWAEDMEGTNDGYPYLLPSPPSVDLRGDPAPKVVEEGGEVFSYILVSEDLNILDYGIIYN